MRKYFLSLLLLLSISTSANSMLFVNLYPTGATCNAQNGKVNIQEGGGVQPYTYAWSNGATTRNLSGLSPGMYLVTVTDAIGATVSGSAVVISDTNIVSMVFSYEVVGSTFTTLSPPCNSLCNGSVHLVDSLTIGTPPYSLQITNSTNANIIPVVFNGINTIINFCHQDVYDVIVTDVTGCSGTFNMSLPGPVRSFDHQLQVKGSCFGQDNGVIILDFLNRYPTGFSIDYSGPDSGSTGLGNNINHLEISNLSPGNYILQLYYPLLSTCDTTLLVTVPDLGTNCGIVSGKVYLDTINNCLPEPLEPVLPQQLIRFDPGPYFTTSDTIGNYSLQLPFNTYSVTLLSNGPLFPVCSISGLILSQVNDTISNVDLADSVNISTDLELGLTAFAFRPGFVGTIYPYLENLSIDLIPNPQLDIYFNTQLTFLSASIAPIINQPGHLSFMLSSIDPFDYLNFYIHFQVPLNPALIGTTFNFTGIATANIPEPDTTNNTDVLSVMVTAGYDPNDKVVDPSRDSLNSFFTDLDDEIQYRIRFQNTGNDTTFNVLVVDTLSAFLDPSTFRFIAASHPVQWEVTGQNVLKFHFNNILLPDSNTNETQSHGVIAFAIKPYVPVLTTTIENRADIYFDFNPAVLTNVVSSFITTSVGLNESPRKSNLRLVPNPAMDYISLNLPAGFDATSFVVTNITGQKVLQSTSGYISERIDISMLPEGYYILKVESKAGEMISGGLVIQR